MAIKYTGTGILLFLMCAASTLGIRDEEPHCSMVSATAASRRFSYSLYNTATGILGRRRNILLSPLAVGMSLSMLTFGATGWSKVQILRALEQKKNKSESPMDPECLLQAYTGVRFNTQFIFKDETSQNNTGRLRTASRLYGDRSLTFRSDFVQNTGKYGVEMDVVFFKRPRDAERRINGWSNDQTEGNIKQLFRPGTLASDTKLALTCAIFFKGTWGIPFTTPSREYFHLDNGRRRMIDFMTSQAPVKYISSTTLKAELVEIPYSSPDGSNIDARLILILPYKNVTLREVEDQLNDQSTFPILKQSAPRKYVRLPKFSLFGEHKLKFFLKRMGVREIFNKQRARLLGSVVQKEGQPRIYVSYTQHKSHFETDETGTQGDSSSFVPKVDTVNPAKEKTVVFNRTFVFLLYDKFTDNIIYIGRLSDPRRKVV